MLTKDSPIFGVVPKVELLLLKNFLAVIPFSVTKNVLKYNNG